MNFARQLLWLGMFFLGWACGLRADQLELQNGDRFSGKVLSVSTDTVVLESDTLGKISVPRQKVARLAFGTNDIAPFAAGPISNATLPTNLPTATTLTGLLKTNADLSAALHQPAADTNVIRQIREQMLAGSPEAAGKYDEMVNGLLSGQMNMADLRREAQSSADELRELKRDLGPDAGDSLDGYLEVLDQFLKESAAAPAGTAPPPKASTP
jgi:hypothetical protein